MGKKWLWGYLETTEARATPSQATSEAVFLRMHIYYGPTGKHLSLNLKVKFGTGFQKYFLIWPPAKLITSKLVPYQVC